MLAWCADKIQNRITDARMSKEPLTYKYYLLIIICIGLAIPLAVVLIIQNLRSDIAIPIKIIIGIVGIIFICLAIMYYIALLMRLYMKYRSKPEDEEKQ
jgi:CHASE2 domain-containing sensor protein